MDKFTENLAGGIRRFAMAGVGAIAITIDKSREIINHLVARGEVTASEGQAACDELQKKMAAQLDAFSKKLKADYENASFESLLKKCDTLTPDQKEALVTRLTADAEETAEDLTETPDEEPADSAADKPAEEFPKEPDDESPSEPSETIGNETDNSIPVEGFEPIILQESSQQTDIPASNALIDSNEEINPEVPKPDISPQNHE